MKKVWLISDTHLKHAKVSTYCKRPEGFTEMIDKNVHQVVKPEDILIHLGDVGIDKAEGPEGYMKLVRAWPGKKWLIRGNHDQKPPVWYVEHGFDFCADAIVFRGALLTHKPWMGDLAATFPHCSVNVHGHLHNVWDGFIPDDPEAKQDIFVQTLLAKHLPRPWHRLFAIEYTGYRPVEFDKFISKGHRLFQSTGPKQKEEPNG